MDITEDQRTELGARVRKQRERQYGTKLAAYQAAALSAATWDRIETGAPVRPDRLRAALAVLWPELDGDWRAILDLPRPSTGLGPGTVRRDPDSKERIEELEARLTKLESLLEAALGSKDQAHHGTELTWYPAEDYTLAALDRDDDVEVEAQQELP